LDTRSEIEKIKNLINAGKLKKEQIERVTQDMEA
jgi:hypothetical protein